MLCCIHTADFGAVALAAVIVTTGAYTLYKYDVLGVLTVTETLKVTLCRTCRIHNSFKFKRCDNVGRLVISIFVVVIKLDCVKACCNNDCTVFFCYDFISLVVVDSTCLTNLFAETALACLELDTSITVNNGNIGNSLSKGSVDSTSCV